MYRLFSTTFSMLLVATNLAAQIVIDTYKDNERRIQTASKTFKGNDYILDVYANEALKDTIYILKIGYHNSGDSVVLGNKFLIKVKAVMETQTEDNGMWARKKELYPDTIISLNCLQVSEITNYPIVETEHYTNFFGGKYFSFSKTNSISKEQSSTYQVAFYKISKTDIEKIISRGTKAIRTEFSNNVFDYKASELAGIIKKLYKQIHSQFKKPCLKQQVDNF